MSSKRQERKAREGLWQEGRVKWIDKGTGPAEVPIMLRVHAMSGPDRIWPHPVSLNRKAFIGPSIRITTWINICELKLAGRR